MPAHTQTREQITITLMENQSASESSEDFVKRGLEEYIKGMLESQNGLFYLILQRHFPYLFEYCNSSSDFPQAPIVRDPDPATEVTAENDQK